MQVHYVNQRREEIWRVTLTGSPRCRCVRVAMLSEIQIVILVAHADLHARSFQERRRRGNRRPRKGYGER